MALLELNHMDIQFVEAADKLGEPYLGSLENREDIVRAVSAIESGIPIVAQVRGVFGLWFRGDDSAAVARIREIKEDDPLKKYSAMMFSQDFVPLIDLDVIPPQIRTLFENPDEIQSRIGGICHIRAPIRPSEAHKFPTSMISQSPDGIYFVHNLDPYGHRPISNLIEALNREGLVKQVGVSTLNRDNEPEIHNLKRALEVARESNIGIILKDPSHGNVGVKGSFPIWDINTNQAVRDGHTPIEVVKKLTGIDIDTTSMKPARYPQITSEFELLLSRGLSHTDLRQAVLDLLHSPKT
jgi:hypothetical protein